MFEELHVLKDDTITELASLTDENCGPFISRVRSMGYVAAQAYINSEYPQLSPSAVEDLLKMCKVESIAFNKSKFYATAYILGATYGQLADLFGVQKSTIGAQAASYLTVAEREGLRVGRSKYSHNVNRSYVSAMKEIYTKLVETEPMLIIAAPPKVIAERVKEIYEANRAEYDDEAPAGQVPVDESERTPIDLSALMYKEETPEQVTAKHDEAMDAFKQMFEKK